MKKTTKYILMSIFMIALLTPFNKKLAAKTVNDKGELRAVWATPITGDVKIYSNEQNFKNEMNEILDMLEYYNLNTLIYHVRTHNNAMYKSELNPKATYYGNVNFDIFDPLEWLINETKSRGIEFHAWMNPYRVSSNYYQTPLPDANPASDPSNLLSYNNSYILNPGLPNVREFISDTIVEFLENYDVDAIHFDDYFYINLGEKGQNIFDETQDQQTFLDYRGDFPNTNSGKQDWRREQVNKMIKLASETIKGFNLENDTFVQFGIAPTGIYKNGNGVVTYDSEGKAITNGSNTRGQTHYSSYLFSDSLKWVNEGWLDYIMPQSYWASNHNVAGYNEVMGWWNKVLKNQDVNLYSGIGLYMARPGTNSYNWINDENEFNTQLNLLRTYNNASGFSIFTFRDLKNAYNNKTGGDMVAKNMNNAKASNLTNIAPLPELKSFNKQTVSDVNNFTYNDGKLKWNKVNNAKAYYIYKSNNNITYDNSEIIKVVGADVLEFEISNFNENDNYAIRVLSKTNHLSEGTLINQEIKTLKEASLRESDNALTFYGKVNLEKSYNNVGFYVAYGELSLSELNSKINHNEIIINNKIVYKKYVDNVNNEGIFHVNLTNIPISDYDTNISVVAFIETYDKLLLSEVYTTSINNVLYGDENLNKYETLDEMKEAFLSDYHTYLNSSENLMTFIHGTGKTDGFDGTWQNDLRTLYLVGVPNRGDNNTFISTEKYYDKWFVFMDFLNDLVIEINNEQSLWGSTWTGDIRIKDYFKPPHTNFTEDMLTRWPEGYQK